MNVNISDTREMASVVKDSSSAALVKLSDQLGGLVLKEEQKLAVEALLSGKDNRRMLKYDINNSFPVVLCHVLNYTSGVLVVDFFYSGPRRKIQMRHNC